MKINLNKVLIIAIITLLFCIIAGTSIAKEIDAKDVNWNVSSSLIEKTDAQVLVYKEGNYTFRIVDVNDNNLSGMKNGFIKDENGFYKYEKHDTRSARGIVIGTYSLAYGEYVKINGNTYWVEASIDMASSGTSDEVEKELSEVDANKLIEYLRYFNENNDVEIVDL